MAIQFGGFRRGSQVTINGTTVGRWADAPVVGQQVWDMTPTAGVGVQINLFRTDHRVAPDGVFFELTLSGFDTNTLSNRYDPSYYDKEVFFDYGEGYNFTAPTQVLAVDAADGGARHNSRYSRGPVGSHVYRTPGTYIVRVAVIEPSSGKIGIATAEVVVADPNVFYAGDKTLFVSTSGSFANEPAGAQRFTSIGSAFAALNAATTPHRIMLERGQTHTVTSSLNFNPAASNASTSFRIEARKGSGTRPVVANTLGNGNSIMIDNSRQGTTGPTGFVLQGIDFVGNYDPVTDTGNEVTLLTTHVLDGAASVITDDITVDGIFSGIINTAGPNDNDENRLLFFNDHAITNWGNIAFFGGQGSKTSFNGTRHSHNPRARNLIAEGNTLNPARIGRCKLLHMNAVDFFQSNGWSPLGSEIACQEALRLFGSPRSDWNKINIQSSVFEAGRHAIYFKPFATSEPSRPQLALFEGNMFIAGHQAVATVQIGHGGACFRNNVCTFAGTSTRTASQFFDLRDAGTSSPANNATTPIQLYSNSLINRKSGTPVEVANSVGFTTVTMGNNLRHMPESGFTPNDPVTLVPAVTPRMEGYDNNGTFDTSKATPEVGGRIPVPQPGSPALDGGNPALLIAGTQFRPVYTSPVIAGADRDIGAVDDDAGGGQIDGSAPALLRNVVSINLSNHNYFDSNQPFKNMIYGARFVTTETNPFTNADGMQPDPVTRLPMQLPSGVTKVDVLWVSTSWGSQHPMLGKRYVIRHNLDTLAPGQYTFAPNAGFSIVSTSTDEVVVDLANQNTNIWFSINTPPSGAFPAGWTIEMIRQSDLALYDSLPALDPLRIFTQEYLDMHARIAATGGKGPALIRFMKPSKSEEALHSDPDDLTRATDAYFADNGTIWPVEFMCVLGNYLDAGVWITTLVTASEAMLTDQATRAAATLRPDLQCWVECCNEMWNWSYGRVIRSNAAYAIERFGTQGAQTGTVSITKGSRTITASGVDLTTVFGVGPSRAQNIVIEGFLYRIDLPTITASSMQMFGPITGTVGVIGAALVTATNVPYLIPNKTAAGEDIIEREPGAIIRSVQAAQVFSDVFTARGERSRLKTVLGSQLADLGYGNRLLDANFWRGEPDFVEPATVFDAIAVNPYFGSDVFSDEIKVAARAQLAISQSAFNDFIESLVDGTNGTYTISRRFSQMATELSAYRSMAQSRGLRLVAYESGTHIAHIGRLLVNDDVDDTDLADAMAQFNYSPNMGRLMEAFCALSRDWLDGPVMQHLGDVGPWGRGQFPLYPTYEAPTNQREAPLKAFNSTTPIWWTE